MKAINYIWSEKVGISQKKAVVFGNFIAEMLKTQVVTTHAVVEAARPENSPIHEFFEWNDEIAAEKFRLTQAAYFLRSLEIVYETDGKTLQTKSVISVIQDDQNQDIEEAPRHYISFEMMQSHPSERDKVKNDWIKDIQGICNRGRKLGLTEFEPIFRLVDELTKA